MSIQINSRVYSSHRFHVVVSGTDVLVTLGEVNAFHPSNRLPSSLQNQSGFFETTIGEIPPHNTSQPTQIFDGQAQVGESAMGDAVSVISIELDSRPHIDNTQWVPAKSLLSSLDSASFDMVGRALQMVTWHKDHAFCGRCGSPTKKGDRGRSRVCHHCEQHAYPRISPCVIGMIRKGNQCLLARNARHPEGMFSTIAGFIESGETAEAAFKREVMEEVGLHVTNVRYAFSQPWPFPGQLMLGFTSDYQSGDICVDNDEIEEAHWFDHDNLPHTPPQGTISGKLIHAFKNQVNEL